MSTSFRPYEPDQKLLLPEDLRAWLPEEPVFGQIRTRGLLRFWLRGLESVQGEWPLWCTTHNLLKLFRSGGNLAS